MVKIKTLLDGLTYLVVILAVGPLFMTLDPSVRLIVLGAYCAGIWGDIRQRYWLGSRIATVLTLLFFAVYSLQLNLSNVVPPVMNILVLLLSVRLLTEKQGRHYLQIFALALFCLAGSSLLSLNIAYFPALVLMVVGVTIGLVLLTFFQYDAAMRLHQGQLSTLLKTAAILPVGSLLLMLILFVVLPRTPYPLWNFLNPKVTATTGFSEQVQPGSFASNIANKSVAFRVECRELVAEDRYWRGTVLNTLKGTVWNRVAPTTEQVQISEGQLINYSLTLPAGNNRFLLTLDLPVSLEGVRYHEEDDRVFTARQRLDKSFTYRGQSRVGGRLWLDSELDRTLYLQRPGNQSPRINQLVARIRQQTDSPSQRLELLQEFFHEQQLSYANSDLPGPTAPIDEFLFDKKRGYCEFFASSFALLSRLCDIPARLVGGYYGGEYNNLGGYYLVTEDLAHVWVEVLVDNHWQRIDPSHYAVNASSALLAPRQQGLSFLQRTMDSLEYVWTQAVINYDLHQQLRLIRSGGNQVRNLLPRLAGLKKPALQLGGGLVIISLLGWWWWRQHCRSPELRLLQRYQKAILQHYNLESVPATLGLLELAMQLDDVAAISFARRLSAALYGNQPLTKTDIAALNALITTIGRSTGIGKNPADDFTAGADQ